MRRTLLLASLLSVIGCAGSEPGAAPGDDGGVRADAAQTLQDAAASQDAGAGADVGGADDAGAATDSGARMDGGAQVDGGAEDAGAAPRDPGPVQCVADSDCEGPAARCNVSAPGGICQGCAEGTCPSGTECVFAACVRTCETQADCNVGFECLGSGRCGLRACDASTPCPAPYVCGPSDTCERPACAPGCPAGLVCLDQICVEPSS